MLKHGQYPGVGLHSWYVTAKGWAAIILVALWLLWLTVRYRGR